MSAGIVIAGGGLAAQRCVEALRQGGYDGRVQIVSAETVAPYDRPPLSKSVIVGTADLDKVIKPTLETYAEDGIELRLGVAVTRGLLLDAAASGDVAAATRSLHAYLDLWEA